MPDWDAIFAELRSIRVSLDKIAAMAASEQTKAELMPVWDCGHRHASRQQAIACKEATAAYWAAKTPEQERVAYAAMRAAGAPPAYGEADVPVNANAGAFG